MRAAYPVVSNTTYGFFVYYYYYYNEYHTTYAMTRTVSLAP